MSVRTILHCVANPVNVGKGNSMGDVVPHSERKSSIERESNSARISRLGGQLCRGSECSSGQITSSLAHVGRSPPGNPFWRRHLYFVDQKYVPEVPTSRRPQKDCPSTCGSWLVCFCGPESYRASTRVFQIVEKVIRKRNRETAIKDKISRRRSTDRGSRAHYGADHRYLSGQTYR